MNITSYQSIEYTFDWQTISYDSLAENRMKQHFVEEKKTHLTWLSMIEMTVWPIT